MANKEDMQDDGIVVVMTDQDGNEYYYEEEMIIPVGDENCGCGCEDEEVDVIIAKIVKGADGEDEYVEPTDEEFEAVQKAYDALVEESEQE